MTELAPRRIKSGVALNCAKNGHVSGVVSGSGNAWATPGSWSSRTIAYLTFGKHLLLNSTVPVGPRELIVLRVGYVQKCAYEWHFHVSYALTAGMTMEEIGAVRDGWNSPVWDGKDEDRAVLRAVDELIGNSCVSDESWAQLNRFFNRQQLTDLVFTVGNYVMVAWAGRTFGIPVEENEDEIGFDLKTRSGNPPAASHRPSEESRGDPVDH
jgi:4-carboxymuconolactone decarboxylase